MISQIIIIDLHSIVQNSADSVRRHKKYSRALSEISNGNLSLKILSPRTNFYSKPLVILFFLLDLKNHLQTNSSKISLLVCGDPWVTLWVTILASKLSKTKIPIQVQCHGDFGSTEWKSQKFLNTIKFNLIFLNFRQVLGLRFVDKKQFQNLRSKISSRHLIQIVPVPLSIQSNPPIFKNLKKFTEKNFCVKLLFVGRLENDRGLKNLYQIMSILNNTNQRFRIYIVGDGTKKDEISDVSNKKFTNLDIQILGYVSGRRLVNLYKVADLLLSLAESESYGRAARESLVCGTPVLAFSSTGMTELKKEIHGNAITLFDNNLENVSLVNLIYKAASKKVNKRTKNRLIQLERVKIKRLIEGWIEIIE